jgi:hypothetical protein
MKTRILIVFTAIFLLLTTSIGFADLIDGLMAYYPFNGNTNDETGNYTALTIYGGATPTTDRFGNPNSAYSFDGIDDYMAGPSYDVINPSDQGSFAISFWFKPLTNWTPTENPNSVIVGNTETPSGQLDWGITTTISYDKAMYFWWNWGVPGDLRTTPDTFYSDIWYHVVANYDVSTKDLSMWINGNLESHTTMIDDIGRDAAKNNLSIARYEAELADMVFDELRLYNRALNEEEIAELACTMIKVSIDIKPESCPNSVNVKDIGVLPVAVLGTEDFDILTIDPVSIRLNGVAPLRSSYEDVSTPPDGRLDLVLKFNVQDIVSALGEVNDGDEIELTLTGTLDDGIPIEGEDCILIISKGK